MEDFDNKHENNNKENNSISNAGKKWTNKEDEQLLEEINNNKSYDEIALNHKRSKYAIILRVISQIIYPKYYDNENDNDDNNDNKDDITNEIISKEYNIDIELLKRNINNIKIKKSIILNRKEKEITKENKEIKINYNEKILEQLILLNKKLDNLIMK
jgi:hypothetical protein